MAFPYTPSSSLLTPTTPSLCSPSTSLISNGSGTFPLITPTSSGVFTMVFIDFDDTLIPTTIRQTLCRNLGIGLFDLLLTTELKKLQYSIIKSVEKIRQHLFREFHLLDHEVRFSIISNAKQKWLDFMFDG
eukprot:229214_1